MTAIENLNRVRDRWQEYMRVSNRVEELEALATKSTQLLTGMPHGGSGKLPDETWAMLADYKEQYKKQMQEYILSSRELEEELDGYIHSSRIKTMMRYRFVDCKTVKEIAELTQYDERWVYQLIKKGREIYVTEWDKEHRSENN